MYYINVNICVFMDRTTPRTPAQEASSRYYEKNKNTISASSKSYYEKNKDNILRKRKETYAAEGKQRIANEYYSILQEHWIMC